MDTTSQAGDFNERIGQLKSWQQQPSGVLIEADNASVLVQVFGAGVVRISAVRPGQAHEHVSYTVVGKPVTGGFDVDETTDLLLLRTNLVELRIRKSPLTFGLYTLDGTVINEDDTAFATSWLGSEVTTYKKPQQGERFIGLGEKTGNLDRTGQAYINWNTDKYGYSVDEDPLYLSTPFYMGVHGDVCYGILLDNTHRSVFNFGASNDRFMFFAADNGPMDYYLVYGENMREVLRAYADLTGYMPLPPKWSLGLQQCRYSYYPDHEVVNVARTFREKEIPADVIYLDIHYMDQFRVFTFHPERFPDPKGMTQQLRDLGFNLAIIVDPGVASQAGYAAYDSGKKADAFVKYPDGVEYHGEVWPGWSAFPDFTKPEAREWWGSQFAENVEAGITGFWNDMNEPAAWGQNLPNLLEFDYDGERANHKKARNVYGMNMARSTFEGTRKLMNGKRPFVLTRSGFAGVQRYSAVWTGDNVATNEHMLAGVRLLNSMGLSGMPFTGYDVGGFDGEADSKLYARWISVGAFSPMFRCHSTVNTRDAEPWSFGEETEQIARNYIRLRYRLMPYVYSTFYEAATDGMPVVRSLAIEYTQDQNVYSNQWQHQYLFGHAIMVCPVESTRELTKVYLPSLGSAAGGEAEGNWYELFTDEAYKGGQQIVAECPIERLPLYVRGGSIVPMQSPVQSMAEKPDTTLRLHIYKGSGESDYRYYEDDGDSYAYQQGETYQRLIQLNSDEQRLIIQQAEGPYKTHFEHVQVYFHGFGDVSKATVNGAAATVVSGELSWFTPVTGIDTFFEDRGSNLRIASISSVTFANRSETIELLW